MANPGAAGSDLRRQFESVLAGGDRSFRGRDPLFDATFRLRPDSRCGNCGGRPLAVRIFPKTKWSPCSPVRASRIPTGKESGKELADRIRSVLDGQRLVSLDTLLALGEGLNEMAQGKDVGDSLLPLAGQLKEFEMPRPMFTSGERSEWAAGFYNVRHSSSADANRSGQDHQVRQIQEGAGGGAWAGCPLP